MLIKTTAFHLLAFVLSIAAWSAADSAAAAESIKIGLVVPLTGILGSVGRQAVAGATLYMAEHGDMAAGRKIELIVRDDTGAPDVSKRIIEELLASQKIAIIGGGITPCVLAIATLATETKTPTVIMVSGTSFVVQRSAYFVRTSWTHAQQASVLAIWAAKNNSHRVTIVSSDWAPGTEATKVFHDDFVRAGGEVVEIIKVPLNTVDFSPFLQRARDTNPDTLFVFVPSSQAAILAKQFVERGLDKTGIRLIGPGDITDDQDLPQMGDAMLGTVTAGFYSANHQSDLNKHFVAAYRSANSDRIPNFISVSAYDGMHLIYDALEKTGGNTEGAELIAAMKNSAWESPRGPIQIDPETRDVVDNIYIRRVERVDGQLVNAEIETFARIRDPLK